MADETKVTIKAKVAQKIINDGDTSYSPLKGELVAIKKVDNNSNNHFTLAIGQENGNSTELNYVEGKANSFYVTAGQSTGAPGEKATAEGNGVTASGKYSHAEGFSTTASGENSHAEGRGTIAKVPNSHVFGEYNIEDGGITEEKPRGDYIEIVGNGTGIDARSNARTLDWNGNERLKGDLIVNWEKRNDPSAQAELEKNNKVVTYKQLVSHEGNGLAPKVNTENSGTNLVLTAKYEDGTTVLSWQVLGAGVTIPVVDSSNNGLAPAFGTIDPENTILAIQKDTNNTFNPTWVKAISLGTLTGYSGNDIKFLVSNQGGGMRWESLIDNDSYNNLKGAINTPISFINN